MYSEGKLPKTGKGMSRERVTEREMKNKETEEVGNEKR
jgi:hypothetical protein